MRPGRGDRERLPDPRTRRCDEHPWHTAINRAHEGLMLEQRAETRFMYEAKELATEVPRMVMLFADERQGRLRQVHKQCSLSAPEVVQDNHLTCCLGVACRDCSALKAIDAADMPDEEKDRAKAWTCGTHIVSKGGDQAREGYLLTEDDKMFWSNVYESLAAGFDGPEAPE